MLKREGMRGWQLQRITAIIIFAGLVVHFFLVHWMVPERPLEFKHIARRMSSGWWFLFDAVLLLAAVYHALYGTYGIVLDFNPREGTKKTLRFVLAAAGVCLSAIGILILIRIQTIGRLMAGGGL